MSRFFMALTALFAFAFSGMLQAGDLAAQQQQPQAQDSITGTITELNENKVTVQTDSQHSMTVRVDRQTRILDEEGQRVESREEELLGNLDSGDWVVVHYRVGEGGDHIAVSIEKRTDDRQQARGVATDQDQQRQEPRQTQDSITGTITELAEDRVTLRTDDQRSMTVRVDRQTRILDEWGQRLEARGVDLLGNLDSGDRVIVNYRTGEDATQRTAVSIEKRAAEQQQVQQQQVQQQRPQQFQRQDELPGTSSALPLIAVLGLIGLAGAGALSVAARRGH
jgi:ribosome maturation factor RimP